jgi:hypothetical protein
MTNEHTTVVIFFDADGDVDLDRSRVYTNIQRARQVVAGLFDLPRKPFWSASMLVVDDSGPLPEVEQLSLLAGVDQDG